MVLLFVVTFVNKYVLITQMTVYLNADHRIQHFLGNADKLVFCSQIKYEVANICVRFVHGDSKYIMAAKKESSQIQKVRNDQWLAFLEILMY